MFMPSITNPLVAMQSDLIFDVGMHLGEDTEFYLKKGFRVVAIEADPLHCTQVAQRLAANVASGQLVILNVAIAKEAGSVCFYRNLDMSIWGTVNASWVERNNGTRSETIEVQSLPMARVFEDYGVPYYMKVDIEGSDLLCIEALRAAPTRPRYLSIESNKLALENVRHEFDLMAELGYSGFKVVPQHEVSGQHPPLPGREGQSVDHVFSEGSSGLFGEEAPGNWVDAAAALRLYQPIFWRYRLVGDNPIIKSWRLRTLLEHRLGFAAGWYDTHARYGPPQ
jgi:FkbM family methyltransferase